MSRTASVQRTTKETDIRVELDLDGSGASTSDTGIPFFDHMLQQLGKHAGWDFEITCKGDLQVDGHHTVEDCGIAVGQALSEALGDKSGVRRFASIVVPLDEAAVEVALDLSGRTFVIHEVPVPYETIDGFDTGLLEDFVRSFAQAASLTVHVHLRSGRSPHHICEAEFKALAKALGDACAETGRGEVPSTKGTSVTSIAVLDYGSGNLHSVSRAIAAVGGDPVVTGEPARVLGADALVIPGVGHVGACMRAICHHGLDGTVRDFVDSGKPVFGVCVGMQVLFEGSDEDPEPGPRRVARCVAPASRRRHGPPHGVEHGEVDRPAPLRHATSTTAPGSTSCTRTRPTWTQI